MPFSLRLPHGLALGVTLLAVSASAQPADVVRARQLLAEARTVAEKWSDPDPARFMVGQVAGAQARAGDRQAALATATSISRTGWGWMAAAKGFADAGDVDAAGRGRATKTISTARWRLDRRKRTTQKRHCARSR